MTASGPSRSTTRRASFRCRTDHARRRTRPRSGTVVVRSRCDRRHPPATACLLSDAVVAGGLIPHQRSNHARRPTDWAPAERMTARSSYTLSISPFDNSVAGDYRRRHGGSDAQEGDNPAPPPTVIAPTIVSVSGCRHDESRVARASGPGRAQQPSHETCLHASSSRQHLQHAWRYQVVGPHIA
jgi:hypothetical protein